MKKKEGQTNEKNNVRNGQVETIREKIFVCFLDKFFIIV
jgi:hypothetical protein